MSSTRSSESAFRSSWNEASIVTCSGSQPRRSTTMFLKSSKLSFWVSNLASSATLSGAPANSRRAAGRVLRVRGAFACWGSAIYFTSSDPPRRELGLQRPEPPSQGAPLSLRLRRGCGLWRSGCHAELGHQVHLVEHEVVPLDQASIDLEDLEELPADLLAGGGDVPHRRRERAVVGAVENTFDDHGPALGDDLLGVDPRVRECRDEGLLVLLDRLRTVHLDAAWSSCDDVRRGVARHRLEVVRVESLQPALDQRLGVDQGRSRDLI